VPEGMTVSFLGIIEQSCAGQPPIRVPSVALLGGSDGVTPPPKTDTAEPHFTGAYRREILGHVGHNVPQKAPQALVQAITEVYRIWAVGRS
jgi:pimeloyl-ACP methyl ester carboxylesterase